jgi:hypothetical protein
MLNMAISMLSSVYMTLYWPSVALMLAWLVMFLVILGVIAERLSEDTTAGSVEPLLAEPRSPGDILHTYNAEPVKGK